MKLFRNLLLATGLAAAILAPAIATAQDIKPRIIRFGYGPSENSNQGRAVKFFAEEMSKRSGGKLKVKGFADASLNRGSKPKPEADAKAEDDEASE